MKRRPTPLLIEVVLVLIGVAVLMWLLDTNVPTSVVPAQVKFLLDAVAIIVLIAALCKIFGLWR